MTSAEYHTIREACGLSQRASATYHGVALRTVQHWEQGRNNIPAGVASEIRHLDALIERSVLEAVDLYADLVEKHEKPDAVDLIRYRTAESYKGSRADRGCGGRATTRWSAVCGWRWSGLARPYRMPGHERLGAIRACWKALMADRAWFAKLSGQKVFV